MRRDRQLDTTENLARRHAHATRRVDDVAQAVDAVAPAFEGVDDRNSAYPLDLICLVADNAWNDGLVLGQFQSTWPDLAVARGVIVSGAAREERRR